MKKIILIAAFAIFSISSMTAQQFSIGVNGGLPLGDAGDISTFSVSADVSYLWEVSDVFQAGVTTGFSNAFGDDVGSGDFAFEIPDIQFLPIAASARYMFSDAFFGGADLGYAVGINDGNEGGIYYRPKIGYGVTDGINIIASYTGISNDGSFDVATLGVEFKL
jgi:hypothetical protein